MSDDDTNRKDAESAEGKAIYQFAMWLEDNQGSMGEDAPGYEIVQTLDEDTTLKGIMFFNEKGSRKFPVGWYVRRNPRWQDVWLERYAADHPEIADTIRARLLPVREFNEYFKHRNSVDVLKQAAWCKLNRMRWIKVRSLDFIGQDDDECEYELFMSSHWNSALDSYCKEIAFRARWHDKAEGLDMLDKDQTKIKNDYALCVPFVVPEAVKHGIYQVNADAVLNHHFSPEYVEEFIQQDTVLADIGEIMPKPATGEIPIRYTSTHQLLGRFMAFVENAYLHKDDNEFEWEDALMMGRMAASEIATDGFYSRVDLLNMLADLKKRFARASGEKVEE